MPPYPTTPIEMQHRHLDRIHAAFRDHLRGPVPELEADARAEGAFP